MPKSDKSIIIAETTLPKKEDATRLSKSIVTEKLGACCQIIGPITSTYQWEDVMQIEEEWILSIKTTDTCYSKLEKFILENHPYKLPQIIKHRVIDGYPSYLNWIANQVELKK